MSRGVRQRLVMRLHRMTPGTTCEIGRCRVESLPGYEAQFTVAPSDEPEARSEPLHASQAAQLTMDLSMGCGESEEEEVSDPIEEATDDLRLLSAMCLERGFEHAGLCLNFRAHWIKNTGLSHTLGYLTALQGIRLNPRS